MLNRKKNKKIVSKTSNSPLVNIISEGTKVVGNINTDSDIRISGIIDGEASSKGKLIVTVIGKIIGNITSEDADIAGKIEGEIRIFNKLILRKSAIVDGDIYTKTLIVEEGAEINGACRMGESSNPLSQLSEKEYDKSIHLKASAN